MKVFLFSIFVKKQINCFFIYSKVLQFFSPVTKSVTKLLYQGGNDLFSAKE